jgi:hypothetical protein
MAYPQFPGCGSSIRSPSVDVLDGTMNVAYRTASPLPVFRTVCGFVGSFKETLPCLQDALATIPVIFSHRTRGDRNQSDTRMMVPASRASRLKGNLSDCNISFSVSSL